jgi:hypothetical protein
VRRIFLAYLNGLVDCAIEVNGKLHVAETHPHNGDVFAGEEITDTTHAAMLKAAKAFKRALVLDASPRV